MMVTQSGSAVCSVSKFLFLSLLQPPDGISDGEGDERGDGIGSRQQRSGCGRSRSRGTGMVSCILNIIYGAVEFYHFPELPSVAVCTLRYWMFDAYFALNCVFCVHMVGEGVRRALEGGHPADQRRRPGVLCQLPQRHGDPQTGMNTVLYGVWGTLLLGAVGFVPFSILSPFRQEVWTPGRSVFFAAKIFLIFFICCAVS